MKGSVGSACSKEKGQDKQGGERSFGQSECKVGGLEFEITREVRERWAFHTLWTLPHRA